MKVYRAIKQRTFEDIDLNNLGCYWSSDEFYHISSEFEFNDISDYQNQPSGDDVQTFVFKAEIDDMCIDVIETSKSNQEHNTESEVTLKENTVLNNVSETRQKTNWKGTINTGRNPKLHKH